MSLQVTKRQFNVAEYYRMAESGILSPSDRVELIEGEVFELHPIGSPHMACVNRLTALLVGNLGNRAQVSIQNPVRLSDFSEPEPDVVLLQPRADFYAAGHPGPADVLLLIEVADSSLSYDRQVKLPLYAKAGIAEVWLVDLTDSSVHVYCQPQGGRFEKHQRFGTGGQITSASLPELTVAIVDILG